MNKNAKNNLFNRIGEPGKDIKNLAREAVQQYIKSSAATTLILTRKQWPHPYTPVVKCGAHKNQPNGKRQLDEHAEQRIAVRPIR
jgi:tRNA A37 threonylcarbamoyladenosine synthetase subunit TsaC/SUA5/YrdC